tara:strand:+ start:2930 stop:3133 length:204 start_codon:yes stop_codon:yes gene_type:complete
MSNKKILSTQYTEWVTPADEYIIDPNIPTGNSPEEITQRWAYIHNTYKGEALVYRPIKITKGESKND